MSCSIYDAPSFCGLSGVPRREKLRQLQADLKAVMSQEQRCELQKCESYCAKQTFDTCRESQYLAYCVGSSPELYDCDVRCNSAGSKKVTMAIAIAAASVVGALLRPAPV